MSTAVCPYCRGEVDPAADEGLVCVGCSTPHHGDCYAENGGCTVFGCTSAPAEEPKVRLSGTECATDALETTGAETSPVAPVAFAARTPPPPQMELESETARINSGNMFVGRSALPGYAVPPVLLAAAVGADRLGEDEKSRMTFILLGVLLGSFGAHNFFGGYRGKAFWQLGLSVLSLGLAIPMVWVWAVIDVCTIDRDRNGVRFVS